MSNAAVNQEKSLFGSAVKPLSPFYYQQSAHADDGMYGPYGGRFVPDNLAPVMDQIAEAFRKYRDDPEFNRELRDLHVHYSGRPTPVYHAANLSRQLGGAQIYLKREDLNHLGAHKLNNVLGQMLLAKRMGKTKVIAETGAGQHGVATAAAAALLGMECTIYMGEEDMRRQELNVIRMRMMGSEVEAVTRGQGTLKEAVDQAFEALVADPDIFYVIGSAVGPHPYPGMVRHFQSVIGIEAREQMLKMTDRLPDVAMACVGGGSNAIGLFAGFVHDPEVALVGVEPGGRGDELGQHAATITFGQPGVLHGFNSYMLKDETGEVAPVYSISAGLDYPGVGPEHSYLKDLGRARYTRAYDQEALDAFFRLSRSEGIIPALESSHALAEAIKMAPGMRQDQIILVNLSGRGDKDVAEVAELMKRGGC